MAFSSMMRRELARLAARRGACARFGTTAIPCKDERDPMAKWRLSPVAQNGRGPPGAKAPLPRRPRDAHGPPPARPSEPRPPGPRPPGPRPPGPRSNRQHDSKRAPEAFFKPRPPQPARESNEPARSPRPQRLSDRVSSSRTQAIRDPLPAPLGDAAPEEDALDLLDGDLAPEEQSETRRHMRTRKKEKFGKKLEADKEDEDDLMLLKLGAKARSAGPAAPAAPPTAPATAPEKRVRKREKPALHIPRNISIANLSRVLKVRLPTLVRKLRALGFEHTDYDYILTSEEANLVAAELNFEILDTPIDSGEDIFPQPVDADASATWPLRPPIVTIMGHVDHGKTTLLDCLRKSSIAAGEAGGITQRIGAFSVQLPSGWGRITFLDTPGHAAFETMRERGAMVTDIVVLVVAGDDGVKPQTVEAIRHCKAAKVNMIVAVTKADRADADVDRVKSELAAHDVHVEDYGGDVQCVAVSGVTGLGVSELENAICTLAEVLDIRSPVAETELSEGYVIESSRDKGLGAHATVVVKRGVLKPGAFVVAGEKFCKVRVLKDEAGRTLTRAMPGTAVEVVGWNEPPDAGDEVLETGSETRMKNVVKTRLARAAELEDLEAVALLNKKRIDEKLRAAEEEEEGAVAESTAPKSLHLVVRADVVGSVEAVVNAVSPIGDDGIYANVLLSGTGEVTESDVRRAQIAKGKIIAFNVPVSRDMANTAREAGVEIMRHNVIYRVIEDVKLAVAQLFPPIIEKRVVGEADILKIFPINVEKRMFKNIAGSRITNGDIRMGDLARVLRQGEEIWSGRLESIRHHKKIVQEMKKGQECGVGLEGFDAFQEGDRIQMYKEDIRYKTLD